MTTSNPEATSIETGATISQLLKSRWDDLTKSDKKVGRALLSVYPLAGLETLADLAERAQVSVPSVIRCIKKLGFEGYPEFQRALHLEVQTIMGRVLTEDEGLAQVEAASDLPNNVKVFQNSIADSFDSMQLTELHEAAMTMSDTRRRILALGGVVSQVLARYFHTHMIRIRPNTELVGNNPLERSEHLLDIGKKDIIVLFDYPNYDEHMLSFARLAKERHAYLVLFTDQGMSPISHFADCVVTASIKSASPFNSMVPAMSVIEVLFSELIDVMGNRARERMQNFEGVPGGVAVNLDDEEHEHTHHFISRFT